MILFQHIRNVAWTVAVGFQMQKNEVIMIDNERFAHARLIPFALNVNADTQSFQC